MIGKKKKKKESPTTENVYKMHKNWKKEEGDWNTDLQIQKW